MTSPTCTTLPAAFCWTRFGVEAGQDITTILTRKEAERRSNDGIFLWGVGNSVLPSLSHLLRAADAPKAVFSPILSRPRPLDVAPGAVAVWTQAKTPIGQPWQIPAASLVTSHAGRAIGQHYALVCRSDRPLNIDTATSAFRFSELKNLKTDRPVGASQVTAIVRYHPSLESFGPEYKAAMVVELAHPYVVALQTPIVVSVEGLSEVEASEAIRDACKSATFVAPSISQYELFE